MRLRTLESFWLLKNGIQYSYPSLKKDIDTQILVVGGGITGALTSFALVEQGYKVVLIDRRDIGQGSTAATTSMLQYEIDVPLYELKVLIGEELAVLCYQKGVEAILKLNNLVNENKIDCGFEMKQSLYLAHNKVAKDELYKEFEARQQAGLDVQWMNAAQLVEEYEIASHGGILSKIAASVDAYKLAHELIQISIRKGMKVFDQTVIQSMELNNARPVLFTENNSMITCDKVIFCNGFEATTMLKEHIASLFYTYASVSEQGIRLPEKLKQTIVWDTHDPYLYMRSTDDGRLLIGGEDSSTNFPFFQQKIKEQKARKLVKSLQRLLPTVDYTSDFNWGGTFGSTRDGLPYIGASPEYANALFVLAFGGNGITFSAQAMELIPAILRGENPAILDCYRFGR